MTRLKDLLRHADSREVQEKVNLDKNEHALLRLFEGEEVEKIFDLAAWYQTQ